MEDLQIVVHKRWKTLTGHEPISTNMVDQLRHDCSKHLVLRSNNHVYSLVAVVSSRQLFFLFQKSQHPPFGLSTWSSKIPN